jgi:hypothetical protein
MAGMARPHTIVGEHVADDEDVTVRVGIETGRGTWVRASAVGLLPGRADGLRWSDRAGRSRAARYGARPRRRGFVRRIVASNGLSL